MTRYCSSPDCPTRTRSGQAAEYLPGVERCADCGADLVDVNPVPTERHAVICAPLKRRLWVTALGATAAALSGLLPSPFVDLNAACAALQTSWPHLSLQLGPFSLGILPLLSGFVLVELVALVVPRWNRRRHGDPEFRHTLTVRAFTVGLLLALLQAYFIALWLEGVGNRTSFFTQELSLIAQPGLSFRLQYAVTASAATLLLGLLALVVTKHGVGNGFAVLLLVDLCSALPLEIYDQLPRVMDELSAGGLIFGAVLLFFLIGGIVLTFLRRPRPASDGLPLFLPTSGLWPLEMGMPLVLLPPTLLTFVDHPWLRSLVEATAPGSTSQVLIGIGAILVFLPLGSWLYWWRFRERLRKPGQRGAWIRAQLVSAALLSALVILWHGFAKHAPPGSTSRLSLLWLVPVVVILGDLLAEIRARRRAPGAADLVPLAEYQHPAEAQEDALGRAPEVGAVVQGLRFRALHYFFAPQVPCRVLGVAATASLPAAEDPSAAQGTTPAPVP